MKNLNLVEIPFSIEEDINKDCTAWMDGKMVKYTDEISVTYYAGHRYGKKIVFEGNPEEGVEKDVCMAFAVRVEKGKGTDELRTECCGDSDVYAAVLPLFEADNIDIMRKELIERIHYYDKSAEVNSFVIDGKEVWLDKDTRVGLMNSTQIQKASGVVNTTLWFDGVAYQLPCDAAIQMLSALEMYALECYNVTAQHELAAKSLTHGFEEYDYTLNYPQHPVFTTK